MGRELFFLCLNEFFISRIVFAGFDLTLCIDVNELELESESDAGIGDVCGPSTGGGFSM